MNDTVTLIRFCEEDAAWLAAQHSDIYAKSEGFDGSFGKLVTDIIAGFLESHDPKCERGWLAMRGGQRLGSIFCVRQDAGTAKLRLFLLLPEARGLGLGKRLLHHCMGFAEGAGYEKMQLWTHESHEAACALYRKSGWQLTGSKPVHSFGVDLVEQSWEFDF